MPLSTQSDAHTEIKYVHIDKNMQCIDAFTLSHAHYRYTHTHKHTCQFISLASDKWACQSACLLQTDTVCVLCCECVWAALCGACWAQLITVWSILEPSDVLWDSQHTHTHTHTHTDTHRHTHAGQGSWSAWGHGRGRNKKLLCVVLQASISVERRQVYMSVYTDVWMIQN